MFGLFLLFPKVASAHQTDEGTLRHAYKPVVLQNKWTRARVDNFSTQPQKRLVCVEAFNTVSNQKNHLGCLRVSLDSFNSQGQWAFEFDAPTHLLSKGTYKVVYTFQGDDGTWHRVQSVNMQILDGAYTAR